MWLLVLLALIVIFYMIGKSKSTKSPKQELRQPQTTRIKDEKRIERQKAKQKKQYDAETERLFKRVEKEMKELKKYKIQNKGGIKRREIHAMYKQRLERIRKMKESDSKGVLIREYMKDHYIFKDFYKSMSEFTTHREGRSYSSSTYSSPTYSSPSTSTGTDYYIPNGMSQTDESRKWEIKKREMDVNDTRKQIDNLRRRGFAIDADEMEPKLRSLEDDLLKAKYR